MSENLRMDTFECPLCSSQMLLEDDKYICQSNTLHIISKEERDLFSQGKLDKIYLRHRAKVRLGKALHPKSPRSEKAKEKMKW